MTTEPVGFGRDLPAQRVMRAQVGGQDMAIWRSVSGKLSAWGNRCPHRGMRLSHGFVRGESLACLYHGWHYGSGGVCNYIPAHPDLEPPNTITTEIFAIRELAGVLWVSNDETVIAPELPENLMPVRSLSLECSVEGAIAAFQTTPVPGAQALTGSVVPDGSNVLTLANSDGKQTLTVLFQNIANGGTTAHILASDDWSMQQMIALSRWGESVRRRAELSAIANTSAGGE